MIRFAPWFPNGHPRTLLWWEQRETCRKCVHLVQPPIVISKRSRNGFPMHPGSGGGMNCNLSNGGRDTSCIGMREEGRRCGPNAKRFKPL